MRPLVVGQVRADLWTAVGLAVFCAWTFWVTTNFAPPVLPGYPGAAFFPQLIIGLLALLSLALFVRAAGALRRARRQAAPAGEAKVSFDWASFLYSVAGALALVLAMQGFGTELAVTAYLALLLWLFGRRPVWAIATAIVTTLVLYALFVHMLSVHLPLLFLPRYL